MESRKLEVVELDPEHRRVLYDLSQQMRELVNFVWRQWEAWHTWEDTSTALRTCLAADRKWRETKNGKRPEWTVKPWPKEQANALYHACTRRFPGLHGRVIVLLLNKLRSTITTKQSSAVPMKWWIAILLDLDGRGTARYSQPIPFDRGNARVLPADEKGRVWLEMRLDRIARHDKRGTSTCIRAALKTGGKRAAYARPAHQMANGDLPLGGAQLFYDDRKKKWSASLTFEPDVQEKPSLDAERVAILRPGRKSCWLLRIDGRTIRLGGRGHHVGHVRKSLLMQRLGRQHEYTYRPKRRGQGRPRALVPLFKLQARWRNFTNGCNHELLTAVMSLLVEHKCGRLVLVGGDPGRLLATAGKLEGREDSTGWPWFAVEQIAEQKANKVGIAVTLRPFCGGRNQRKSMTGQGLRAVR